MKVKFHPINDHFASKNNSLKKEKLTDIGDHLVRVYTQSEGWIYIRKDLNTNFIELNHGNIIIDIVGKTKGKKIYKRGDNYLLV